MTDRFAKMVAGGLSDYEIAIRIGSTPAGVRSRRRVRGLIKGVSQIKGIDWSAVDWSMTNSAIARSLGVAISTARSARTRHSGGIPSPRKISTH